MYLLFRYKRPGGPWQRHRRCLSQARNSSLFLQVYPFPTPGPACAVVVEVSPRSPSPQFTQPQKRQTDKKQTEKKEKQKHKRKQKGLTFWASPYSSIPSPSGSAPPSTSGSPSFSTSGVSTPGASFLFSLIGGGGGLHPLAACWAIFLAAQASALAP